MYVFEPCEGVSHGRNAGVRAGRGAILAFVDDDVRVSPSSLASAVCVFDAEREMQFPGGPVFLLWEHAPPGWLTPDHWAPIAVVDYGPDPHDVPADRALCLISANLFMRGSALDPCSD